MNTEAQVHGWENYPTATASTSGMLDDFHEVRELIGNYGDLFVQKPSAIHLQVYRAKEVYNVSSLESLESFLKGDGRETEGETKFFFITQTNSWTRLQISLEMFKMLCHVHGVFPRYFQSVLRLSLKTCKTYEYLGGGCFRHVSVAPDQHQSTIFEVCYNLRKFERHGRDVLDDPWSCRQCAVYQKYTTGAHSSAWIFIQLPKTTRELLGRIHEAGEDSLYRAPAAHPLLLHLLLLWSCEKTWEEYIRYLGNEITAINDKTSFLNNTYRESDVKLTHCQNICRVQWELENALLLLEANLDVANTLVKHSKSMHESTDTGVTRDTHASFLSEIEQYQRTIECHMRNIQKHLRFATVVNQLTLKILDFQNDELRQANSNSLKSLASQTVSENKAMVTIAEKTKAHSRMMAVATLIATIYLPASFVASFFGTNMVQYNTKADGDASSITVRKDVWVYVMVSVVLMVCTTISAYFLTRRLKKQDEADTIGL
ncbi:hypothetical protein BZA05DRAFT_405670 [Tricharina praecox]|uniref:uncharacterized protein n=1 Tax=Tricharina praecox TaxID=43433 RepID=UPI00221FEA42|nr:uncharacterized protein BZA05DRAFT_405670 [Tricharina praecox]KAI5846857.1 hypothetical protein BZA05DRAFT_405670 [Tricharina praecox]